MAIYENGVITRFDSLGFQQLTVSTTAVALTLPSNVPPENILRLLIRVDGTGGTNDVRFRDDGTDPTATIGIVIPAGTAFVYEGNPANLKLIRALAANAVVNVAFYGR